MTVHKPALDVVCSQSLLDLQAGVSEVNPSTVVNAISRLYLVPISTHTHH